MAHSVNVRRSIRINPVARAVATSRRRAGAFRDRKKYDRKRDKKNVEKHIDNRQIQDYKDEA